MLSEIELAFGENLLLLGGITGPRLSYALRARQGDSRPLWELVSQLALAQAPAVAEAHRLAEAAMQVAGPSAFSFSTGAMVGPWELVDRTGVGIGGEVWSATRPGGDVATLRVVPPGTGKDPERTMRFVERSNVGLDPPHPSLLKIDEADEDFGWLYAATIGLECKPLAAMMNHGPIDEHTARAVSHTSWWKACLRSSDQPPGTSTTIEGTPNSSQLQKVSDQRRVRRCPRSNHRGGWISPLRPLSTPKAGRGWNS